MKELDIENSEADYVHYMEQFISTFARYEWFLHVLCCNGPEEKFSALQVFKLLEEAVFPKVFLVSDYMALAYLPAAGSTLWGPINGVLQKETNLSVQSMFSIDFQSIPVELSKSVELKGVFDELILTTQETASKLTFYRMMGPLMMEIDALNEEPWLKDMQKGLTTAILNTRSS